MLLPLIQNLGAGGPSLEMAVDFELRARDRIHFEKSTWVRVDFESRNRPRLSFRTETRKYPP